MQKRTSPPKFLENRGSRMGVPGAIYKDKTEHRPTDLHFGTPTEPPTLRKNRHHHN